MFSSLYSEQPLIGGELPPGLMPVGFVVTDVAEKPTRVVPNTSTNIRNKAIPLFNSLSFLLLVLTFLTPLLKMLPDLFWSQALFFQPRFNGTWLPGSAAFFEWDVVTHM